MSSGPIDLADVVRWLDRPRATHPDTGPGNGGRPGPCNDEPTVAELSARARRTVTDLYAAIERSKRARGADVDLSEVA